MMKFTILFEILVAAVIGAMLAAPLPALADDGGEVFGTVVGATTGGLIGSSIGHGGGRTAATVGGVVVGGVVGNRIGHSYDTSSGYYPVQSGIPNYNYSYDSYPYDMFTMHDSVSYRQNYVAPPDEIPPALAIAYQHNYSPPPPVEAAAPIYVNDTGAYCRQVSKLIQEGEEVRETFGTACMSQDGKWHVVH